MTGMTPFYGVTGVGEAQQTFPGPDDTTRVELPNGIVVLARPNFNSPSVVINGFLLAGNLSDPDDRLGLADFTASCLMRGTKQRDFQTIYNELESVGASLGFHGGTHTSSFGGRSLVEDLDLLLELLSQALRAPVFPPDHIEKLRAQFLTGLAIRAQDTTEMASLAFDQLVYAGHPYARPEDGYPETIMAIQRADLVDFHGRYYGPRGTVISMVGGVDPQMAVDKVASALVDWQNPGQETVPTVPPVQPLKEVLMQRVTLAGKSQSDLVMGSAGPARRSPDYLPAALGNSILGQFGMYGRIGEVVREQAGLAYYAYSSLSGGVGPGPWYISAGVDPLHVDRALELIRGEIARFIHEPVTAEELSDNKENFIGRLPLSLESNGGVAGALLNLERYELGLDYYRRFPGLVKAVTQEEILDAARRYLDPDHIAIAVAGP